MTRYFVLVSLNQPDELMPGKPNPKYGKPGESVEPGEIITDEIGGFLEHRTDPKTGDLKPSYYADALRHGLFVRVGEKDVVIDAVMQHVPEHLARMYYQLIREEQAAAEAGVMAQAPARARKAKSAPETILTEDDTPQGVNEGSEE